MFKRALLAAAVAAAVSAPAFAEVAITGSMEMNFVAADFTGGDEQYLDRGLVLNFDGSDKLDSGSKLIWRVSQKITSGAPTQEIAASGTGTLNQNTWGGREAWVGLSGDWGTFKAGRQFLNSYLTLDWPYGQGGFWQLAENNWATSAAAGKLTANFFAPTSVNYQSPNFGGFSFGVQHSWDTFDSQMRPAWGAPQLDQYTITDLSASFSTGSLNLNAGYLFGEDIAGVGTSQDQYYIGATYGFDFGLNVRALYTGYSNDTGAGAEYDGYDWIVGGTYGWGKSFVKAAYQATQGDQATVGAVDDGEIWSIEYGYSLSKNTVGYVRYQDRSEDLYGDYDYVMVGVWTGF
ncbi:porin [Chitinibacter sp. S2-10]|uniref:porin n=1 Tax=Chitinibacter sp. S2-10 TaxID=3373597 RepID=UPI003977C075